MNEEVFGAWKVMSGTEYQAGLRLRHVFCPVGHMRDTRKEVLACVWILVGGWRLPDVLVRSCIMRLMMIDMRIHSREIMKR